jgi:hypothetical protein
MKRTRNNIRYVFCAVRVWATEWGLVGKLNHLRATVVRNYKLVAEVGTFRENRESRTTVVESSYQATTSVD